MKEKIIVTLTSYKDRLANLPVVLDTIYHQTVAPDQVVLNLANETVVPAEVQEYLDQHGIITFRVPDTKVYKKLVPTLKRFPDDVVIAIDDDWLYPQGMIEDFMETHERFPDHPISGHGAVAFDMMCHCGCASLTMARFFGETLDLIDDSVILNCPSDDIVYTYFSIKAGHPYVRPKGIYFTNMVPYNAGESYSLQNAKGIEDSYQYLVDRFGPLPNFVESYLGETQLSEQVFHVHETICQQHEEKLRATKAFRIGKTITKPFAWVKRLLHNDKG